MEDSDLEKEYDTESEQEYDTESEDEIAEIMESESNGITFLMINMIYMR